MKLTLAGFLGANLLVQERLLPEGVGVSSLNQRPGSGDLEPWKQPLHITTVPPGRMTIYRFGRDVASDSLYWFTWAGVVHVCRGFIAADTSERTYFTGDGAPKVTDNTVAVGSAPYPTAARLLGVPRPTSAITLTESTAGTGIDELRYYVQTFVTDRGEESAPSPVESITCKPGAVIEFGTLEGAPANHGITKRRIYRTQAGTSGSADFFFLREDLATQVDGIKDDARALGADTLVTTGWELPPPDLKHLTVLWNGIMAGISGRSVRYCEPYKPYAWPIAYETLPPDVTPVALVVYGGTLLVLTNGQPRRVTGDVPEGMDDGATDFDASCISEGSVQGFGHGACWASPDGLAYYGAAGPKILTAGLLKPEQWQAMNPSSIVGAQFAGLYLGFYDAGSGWKGFAIDPLRPTGIYFLSQGYPAAYFDKLRNALFVLDGTSIKKWNSGAAFMTATFRSKVMVLPQPINMARLRVIADDYPATVRVYGDGVLRATKVVADREPVMLPAGYRASEYQVEVEAASKVTAVEMATSLKELQRA